MGNDKYDIRWLNDKALSLVCDETGKIVWMSLDGTIRHENDDAFRALLTDAPSPVLDDPNARLDQDREALESKVHELESKVFELQERLNDINDKLAALSAAPAQAEQILRDASRVGLQARKANNTYVLADGRKVEVFERAGYIWFENDIGVVVMGTPAEFVNAVKVQV